MHEDGRGWLAKSVGQSFVAQISWLAVRGCPLKLPHFIFIMLCFKVIVATPGEMPTKAPGRMIMHLLQDHRTTKA
jgi:hypothetical protein